jgi:hypothetical protein
MTMRAACGFRIARILPCTLFELATLVPEADFFDEDKGRIVRVSSGKVAPASDADAQRIRAALEPWTDRDVDPDDADFFVDQGDFLLPGNPFGDRDNLTLSDNRSVGSMTLAAKEIKAVFVDVAKYPEEFDEEFLDLMRWLEKAIAFGQKERLALGVAYF